MTKKTKRLLSPNKRPLADLEKTARALGLTWVGPSGPTTAPIVLIGEAPGRDEVREGAPFVGAAGRFLNVCLEKAGIDRAKCYITNVVKVRPPDNDLSRLTEYNGMTAEDWHPSLQNELLTLVKFGYVRVVIALGDTALNALCSGKRVTKWRGSVLECPWLPKSIKVVPTYHPSRIMQYEYKMHPAFIHDLVRAAQIAENGWKELTRTARIKPTFSEAVEYIRECAHSPAFAWDLETFGPKIACLGLALSPTDSMCIPFKNGFANYWSYNEELSLWFEIARLMSSRARKYAHNAIGFDHEYLRLALGDQPAPPVFDTYLAHYLANPELPHRLDFLSSIYTDMPYYKDDTKDATGEKFTAYGDRSYFEDLWTYNCQDALATFEIGQKLEAELKELGIYKFFVGYVQPLYRCLFEIQNTGIRIDPHALAQKEAELHQKEQEALEFLRERTGGINPNSPKQVAEYLYRTLGLPVQYQKNAKKTRTVSVDEAALTKLARLTRTAKHTTADITGIVSALLELRQSRKLKSTYLNRQALTERPDGSFVWLTSYRATETGRLSSRSRFDGTGLNVQNIPSDLRSLVIPRDGWKLMEPDLKQAEARAVAYLSGCKSLIQEFDKPDGDVFRMIGSWVLGKHPSEITKEERQLMKATVHGSNYLMGERTFAEHLGITPQEARSIQVKYFQNFPEIKLWHERTRQALIRQGVLKTPFGRVRRFLGRLPYNEEGHDTLKEAMAFVPQSTVVDYMNQGLVKLHLWARTTDYCEVWLQNHDGLLIHYRADKEALVIRKVQEFLTKTLIINGQELYMPLEIKIGMSWKTMTPYNP